MCWQPAPADRYPRRPISPVPKSAETAPDSAGRWGRKRTRFRPYAAQVYSWPIPSIPQPFSSPCHSIANKPAVYRPPKARGGNAPTWKLHDDPKPAVTGGTTSDADKPSKAQLKKQKKLEKEARERAEKVGARSARLRRCRPSDPSHRCPSVLPTRTL